MDITSDLKKISGKNILTSQEELIPYMRDASPFHGELPLAVAIPENVMELSRIVKYCYEHDIVMVSRGGGSSLTGSSVPLGKGIVISLAKFDKILETKIEDRYVVAESGVRLDALNEHLSNFDHFYPPDPASSRICTVGGTISTNSGGLRGAMYGVTKDWVLGMEVVLPNGDIVQFGSKTLKRSAGYDFTSLMIGSEGTIGIITKAILKIWPKPEKTGRILSYYEKIESGGKALAGLKAKGINPLIAEFMDRISLESMRVAKGIGYPEGTNYMLMIDIASTVESLERQMNDAAEILKEFNPISLKLTTDKKEMSEMYEARKGLYSTLLSQRKSASEYLILGDVVVPASELPAALNEIERAIEKHGIFVSIFGHIGDGNIHANIFSNPADVENMRRVDNFQMELGRIAVSHGGSVSAEHGVGIEKKELLKEEFTMRNSPGTLSLMKAVKLAIDPKNLMNRGKIFD